MIEIREFTIENYKLVYDLWETTEGIGLDADSDSREAVAGYLKRNPGLSFFATAADQVVGAVLCGHDGRRGYLHHLTVTPTYRNNGIGRMLIKKCLTGLAAENIQKCNIFLYSDNHQGRHFWQHNKWNSRDDLLVLQKLT